MNIKDFSEDWKEVRGKTYEFINTVPEGKMQWSPHKDLGTFGQQMRHLGVSQRAYIRGIQSGRIDFLDKSYDQEIERNKSKAVLFLKTLDKELMNALHSMKNKPIDFHDGVYGTRKVDVKTVLDWLLQHETYHQGVFTCYGRIAGLGKFRLM